MEIQDHGMTVRPGLPVEILQLLLFGIKGVAYGVLAVLSNGADIDIFPIGQRVQLWQLQAGSIKLGFIFQDTGMTLSEQYILAKQFKVG